MEERRGEVASTEAHLISAATSGSQGVDLVFLKVGDDRKEIAGLRVALGANMHIRIAGTSLDKGVELDALAALPEEQHAPLGMHQLIATELAACPSAPPVRFVAKFLRRARLQGRA